jgi:outer membrane protein assembly factor BamB
MEGVRKGPLAVIGLAVAAAVGVAVVVTREDGGGGDGGGSDEGDGWVAVDAGDAKLLASDGETVCSSLLFNQLTCLDAATGDEVFTVQIPEGELLSSPILAGDQVVLARSGMSSGRLTAFGLDGEPRWDASMEVRTEAVIPVVADGAVAAVVDSGQLVGVDLATGEDRWRQYGDKMDFDVAHVSGDNAYTDGTLVYASVEAPLDPASGDTSGTIVAIDGATGAEAWRSPELGDIGYGVGADDAAAFADGSAVAFLMGGTPRRVIALDNASGALRWEVPVASDYADIVDVGDATVVVDGRDMRAYDRQGTELWHVPTPVLESEPTLLGPGRLVFSGERLFLAGYDLYEIDPATGASVLLDDDVVATDAAVAGDLLLIAGTDALIGRPLDALPPLP